MTVSNLAVVEKAEALFASGLNVITGETGAGKSVLMGALELVLGGRADSSLVREGAKEAEVEAEFDGAVIRRTVTREGKSRVWIDDEAVTVAELREKTAGLVDIHGPRANQRLLDEGFQREALDGYRRTLPAKGARKTDADGEYAARFGEFSALNARLTALKGEAYSEDELDMLRFQVGELEEAALTEEDETLDERHAAAAHAEEIVAAANEITEALGGERGAAEILCALQPKFAGMARHFPAAGEWRARAESLTVELQDLSRSVADAASSFDLDAAEFEEMDRRLGVVKRLERKYRATTVAELMGVFRAKKERLGSLEHREEDIARLGGEVEAKLAEVRKLGAGLTRLRRAAAENLSKAVTAELRELGFRSAGFRVAVEPAAPAAHGCDRVVCMFAPNPGEAERPLAAIASSGEIARVMLALKICLSGGSRASGPSATLVFDEIDANIGGETGAVVGAKMRELGRSVQVIAITHLPQSAVYGDRHLTVAKTVAGGRTRTAIRGLEGDERVHEIARMLGGEDITSVVKRHAQELLKLKGTR